MRLRPFVQVTNERISWLEDTHRLVHKQRENRAARGHRIQVNESISRW
jgi:hypothetical protein